MMNDDYYPVAPLHPGPLPVSADWYHVYVNVETGEWGDRADLAILTLTEAEMIRFRAQTNGERKSTCARATRYFGNVANARGTRKHLSTTDLG